MKKMKALSLVGCTVMLSMAMTVPAFADADTAAGVSDPTTAESDYSLSSEDMWEYLAVADVTTYANIRSDASIESQIIGELHPGYLVKVEEEKNGWTEVTDGKVEGYILSELLLTGDEAKDAYYEVKQNAVSVSDADLKLLAAIIHCEAGGESEQGKIAVGAVVLNRVKSASFPNSIHDVIYQSGQFTPAMTGWLNQVLAGNVDDDCYAAAKAALAGQDPTNGCLYFHAGGGSGLTIGNQTFY